MPVITHKNIQQQPHNDPGKVFVGVHWCVTRKERMDTKLSKSTSGRQLSAQACNALRAIFAHICAHSHRHTEFCKYFQTPWTLLVYN